MARHAPDKPILLMRLSPHLNAAAPKIGNLPIGEPIGRLLTVGEVAAQLQVTDRHVVNLIEEGSLAAIDVAGNRHAFLMPLAAIPKLASRLDVRTEQLVEFIRTVKPADNRSRRALWRVPVENYTAFMEKRSSMNLNPTK
jgi:excisionase family DNA binding protein